MGRTYGRRGLRPIQVGAQDETVAELFARLRTTSNGLSSGEAAERLAAHGPNVLSVTRLRSKILEFLRAVVNPLVVILLVAGTASAFLGDVGDAVIIAAIVLLSSGLNFWQTFRSERAVKRLQQQIAPMATVLRDGAFIDVPRREIVVGDVIRLGAGDLVPADARLFEGDDLHAQQAALTGESLPAEKGVSKGKLNTIGPDCPDLVYLGTSIVSGAGEAVVFATGPHTSFGDIVERLAARPEETEFERGTRHFGMLIMQTVMFLVLFILIVNVSLGRDALRHGSGHR